MKKKLSKFIKEQKELMLKGCLLSSVFCIFLFFVFDIVTAFFKMRNPKISVVAEFCSAIAFGLAGIFIVVFIYLTTKIEFIENKIVSKKIEIKAKSYIEFEEKIKETLVYEEYDKEQVISNNLNCDIKYFVRENRRVVDIFLLVNVLDNLTEEIREQYLEYCYNKIKEDHPNIEKKEINFLHIVCVPKTSDEMRKISERGIEQATKRYQLAVTVSFSNSKVYIAPARNEIWSTKYNILKNRMIKYLDNQINKDVSKEGDA